VRKLKPADKTHLSEEGRKGKTKHLGCKNGQKVFRLRQHGLPRTSKKNKKNKKKKKTPNVHQMISTLRSTQLEGEKQMSGCCR